MRNLAGAALLAGIVSGAVLFLLQYRFVVPLIAQAETYESHASEHEGREVHEWEPAAGVERATYTAIGTVLTGVAFSAIALGVAALVGWPVDVPRGVVLGLAGFVSFVVAPSLGLRPNPPGVPGPDVLAAQVWWTLATVSTVVGFALMAAASKRPWVWPAAAVLWLLPHVVGAPHAAAPSQVPVDLVERFARTSIATRLPFWLLIGIVGGWRLAASSSPGRRTRA